MAKDPQIPVTPAQPAKENTPSTNEEKELDDLKKHWVKGAPSYTMLVRKEEKK